MLSGIGILSSLVCLNKNLNQIWIKHHIYDYWNRFTIVISSPITDTSGSLKWAIDETRAILAQSKMFPSWLSTFMSARICHTFSPALIHKVSMSRKRDCLTFFSSKRFNSTEWSVCLQIKIYWKRFQFKNQKQN